MPSAGRRPRPRPSANAPAPVRRDGPFFPKSDRRARRCYGIAACSRDPPALDVTSLRANSRILSGDSRPIAGTRFLHRRNLWISRLRTAPHAVFRGGGRLGTFAPHAPARRWSTNWRAKGGSSAKVGTQIVRAGG